MAERARVGLRPSVTIYWLCYLGQATWPLRLGVPTCQVEVIMHGCED